MVMAPAPDAGAQQAHVSAHDPAEGSDADVLMGEVAADAEDVAAEPVVSGVPFSMEGSRGRQKRGGIKSGGIIRESGASRMLQDPQRPIDRSSIAEPYTGP